MATISMEEGLKLRQIGTDYYEAVQQPWTWPFMKVVPGPVLMALAAAAAYETVSDDFAVDTLQVYFLAAPKADGGFQMRVQRINDGGRFCTRTVTIEQAGVGVVLATCTFVRLASLSGSSMQHAVKRATQRTVDAITLDDLEPGRGPLGSYFKSQRLAVDYTGPRPRPEHPSPESYTYTSVAQVSPPIKSDSRRWQALGLIMLSDYHVMNAVPTIHGVPFGQPAINDTTRTRVKNSFERATTLNHAIRFHRHEGFRTDDLCYIEATTPWSNTRRGEVHSRIFEKNGRLIATCVQEAYYVFKSDKESKI